MDRGCRESSTLCIRPFCQLILSIDRWNAAGCGKSCDIVVKDQHLHTAGRRKSQNYWSLSQQLRNSSSDEPVNIQMYCRQEVAGQTRDRPLRDINGRTRQKQVHRNPTGAACSPHVIDNH